MKDKSLYIRCSGRFLDKLDVLCNKFNLSQSDLLSILVYTINDIYLVDTKHIDIFKFIDKQLKKGNDID